jgi:hypothetical protein
MATEETASNGANGDPAIDLLSQQRDTYASTVKRLEAQHKGVEAKLFSTRAKLEATEEAIKALEAMRAKKN